MTKSHYINKWEKEKEEREEKFVHKTVQKAIDNDELVVTKRGVFKNLKMSPHEIVINDRVLKFSSEAKKRKFETDIKFKKIRLENSFKRFYGQNFDRKETNFDEHVNSMTIIHYNMLKLK